MEKRLHPEANDVEEVVEDHTNLSFFEQFERFLIYKGYPYSHRKDYDVLARLLKRFERFRQIETGKDFKLELSALTSDTLVKIRDFVLHENLLMESKRFAVIYVEMPEDKKIGQRGYNTMVRYMKRMRTFIKWCLDDGLLMKDPFGKFTIGNPREGKPFYINMEERDVIAKTDMAARWAALTPEQRKEICQNPTPHALERLTIQRDIFIFQCMIGCRVGDLMKFTYANLNNGVLTYVPHKTKDNISSSRVSIPLNQTAMEIVLRYESHPLRKGRLLPFLCTSKYNLDIKSIFKLCGIDRIVPVLNALTSEYEMKPLYEVASSHMAREHLSAISTEGEGSGTDW
jgi:integrase